MKMNSEKLNLNKIYSMYLQGDLNWKGKFSILEKILGVLQMSNCAFRMFVTTILIYLTLRTIKLRTTDATIRAEKFSGWPFVIGLDAKQHFQQEQPGYQLSVFDIAYEVSNSPIWACWTTVSILEAKSKVPGNIY